MFPTPQGGPSAPKEEAVPPHSREGLVPPSEEGFTLWDFLPPLPQPASAAPAPGEGGPGFPGLCAGADQLQLQTLHSV